MLTSTQLSTLKAYIEADPVMSQIAPGLDGSYAIADLLNQPASPAYIVWRTGVPVDEISDKIAWSALTPVDPPDDTQTWANRSLACQGKQFNLQLIIAGRALIPANLPNVRAGLQDALTGIPSGAGGVAQAAGWTAVRTALQRSATVIEKLFVSAGGSGTAGSPSTMTIEGPILPSDVDAARNS